MRPITVLTASCAAVFVLSGCEQNPTEPSVGAISEKPAAHKYTSVDLAIGRGSVARDVNPAGQIVGTMGGLSQGHAFLWHRGVVTDLGTLGGIQSAALGINPQGVVVGSSSTAGPTGYGPTQAFVWAKGVMTRLNPLPGACCGGATDINSVGQVVGHSDLGDGAHAVLWQKGGAVVDLGTLGGQSSVAQAINAAGQIVGWSELQAEEQDDGPPRSPIHAFLWQNGVMTDLGPGLAFAINSAGQVVGVGEAGHAVIWEKGTIRDLGTLGGSASYAYGINDAGQVVGESWTVGDRAAHAFLWEKGVMSDLGATLGGKFSRALAINPAGQVVGESTADGLPPAMTASLWTRKKIRN